MALYRIIINTVHIIIFVRLIFVHARLSENIWIFATDGITCMYWAYYCMIIMLLYDY